MLAGNDTRVRGKILSVNKANGYGSIESKVLPFKKIYFYWSALLADTTPFTELHKGMHCEFKLIEDFIDNATGDHLGPRALNVDILED